MICKQTDSAIKTWLRKEWANPENQAGPQRTIDIRQIKACTLSPSLNAPRTAPDYAGRTVAVSILTHISNSLSRRLNYNLHLFPVQPPGGRFVQGALL